MTLTLAGIAGFVLSVGMAVDANILIFERMKEELRLGKSLPSAVEAGFNRAWNSILDSNVSSLITATILYAFGSSVIRGFALVLIIGVLVSMFSAIVVTRSIMRVMVRQPWARKARLVRAARGRVHGQDRRSARRVARRSTVFDIIGKRRWFYAISLAATIPGLIFILLTPFTDLGLQFTIDYTGGTKWEIRFEDASVTPEQVEAVFAEQGLAATAVTTGSGFIEIKTEPIGLVEQAPAPSAAPSASRRRRRPGAPVPDPSASAAPSASRAASPSASPTPSAAATRQHRAADDRQARRGPHRPRGRARPDRRAEQPDDHRPGRQLRPRRPGADPDPRGLPRASWSGSPIGSAT